MIRRLLRDCAYVLPGLPIAVFGFSLLISLTAASIVTAPLWFGALLLPLTLIVASGFAELSRRRLWLWGAIPEPVVYRPRGPGMAGMLKLLSDPRRWLDLVFESVIALPVRLVTFVIAVLWIAMGPAGITYFFWSRFLPGERGLIQLLELIAPAVLPAGDVSRYLLDSAVFLIIGVIFLVTLPALMHGLAWLDAVLATSLLGAGGRGRLPDGGSPTQEAPAIEPSALSTGASFSAQAWSWMGAVFAAVVLCAVGWPVTAAVYQVNVAGAMVLTIAHCGALVLTLRHQWSGVGLSLVAAAALMGATAESGVGVWPWPVTVLLTQCGVLLVAALRRRWYCAASGWAASALLTAAAVLAAAPEVPSGALSTAIVFASVSAGVVLLGSLTRQWILNAGRLQASEEDSAQQTQRRRELEERNRIARELHDVVAHSMSVISVQAATAKYRTPGIGESAQREFDEIARSSRQALGEMRMLLGILRGEDEAPTGPTPGLEDIGQLVESTRASGATIRAHGLGALPEIPSAVGLAAYRLVQEALSNALRHAPGSTVEVTARVADGRLRLSVVNSVPPTGDLVPAPGAGLGLAGIRERVSAVGGEVETGPTPEGGFCVEARLPLA
ncbi:MULTISPECIES: sensor histidine kinase [Nesterenkonia]|uniref:histidine kinase n=1 Tax=Nesterenkonia xinjiangensis TaxID=225327 RepID=A0A7Z0GM99_9MICC|nr:MULTISPECIES: sensor histidine kinase [Nesterenkonia]MDZ5078962.1 sensor domain-containing protein [Nesterenkonia sp. HG001]NYJ77503.1 signal transduction histidine kinase [Nesterenkonia xinjiangensis]